MGFKDQLQQAAASGQIPQSLADRFLDFFDLYMQEGAKGGYDAATLEALAAQYFKLIAEQVTHPYQFELYHQQIRAPFDFYLFPINLFRPLVDYSKSKVLGQEYLKRIEELIKKGENVVLLSNHQIEPDPQAISLLLGEAYPELVSNMIFVAGHRVITDPIAVPFSKGVNLLCIFSKNYVENPPEEKHEKLMRNRRTMQKMAELLSEGGKLIYVAPSGGRDRPDPVTGKLDVAPFDPNSIEMFRLMALQAKKPTHFFTLALATHDLLPPPLTVEDKLGERRAVKFTPIHLAFGPEIDMDGCIPQDLDKSAKRTKRATYIWQQVKQDYDTLKGQSKGQRT